MPVRWRKLLSALVAMGCTTRPGRGSHVMVTNPITGQGYPFSPHGDGHEVSDKMIKLGCRKLGLDEAELRRLL